MVRSIGRWIARGVLFGALGACGGSTSDPSTHPGSPQRDSGDTARDALLPASGNGGGTSTHTPPRSISPLPGVRPEFACPDGFKGQVPRLEAIRPRSLATAAPDRFLEGPVWAGNTLYVSELARAGSPAPSRLLRLDGATLKEVLPDAQAGTNGLAAATGGWLVAASQRVHGLLLIAPGDRPVHTSLLVNRYQGRGFNSPNDLVIGPAGDVYFTDPDWNCGDDCPQGKGMGRVYHLPAAGGNSTVRALKPPHTRPNGIALSPDATTLYVGGDDAGIWSYAVDSAGVPGEAKELAALRGVDGLAVDCAGNLYVTQPGEGVVAVLTPQGALVGRIQSFPGVTNVAFGGLDRRTLFITYDNKLGAVDLEIPGLPN